MVPGPVFWLEITTTARRGRYHLLRIGYAVSLLMVLWTIDWVLANWMGRRFTSHEMGQFAHVCLLCLAMYQELVVLLLTPLIVAGVIAEAKQRRILHDLLTSDLTSSEIVIGKMLARLAHVAVFLVVSLPVLCMLSLLGGVDPGIVLLVTAGSAATALFVAGLAILLSTLARRVRDALFSCYALIGLWLAAPYLLRSFLPTSSFRLDALLQEFSNALELSSPVGLVLHLVFTTVSVLVQDLTWMIAIQTVCGVALAIAASLLLRPTFRRQEGHVKRARRGKGERRQRARERTPWSADPMLWKELHGEKGRGIVRRIGRLVVFLAAAAIVYQTIWLAIPAFEEVKHHGYASAYGSTWGKGLGRWDFNLFLSGVTPFIYLFLAILLAGAASSGIAYEREQDTWTALLTTQLNGREILRAKALGALWSARWGLAFLVAFWCTGLAAGAIHPVGFALALVELGVFAMFAVAAGTLVSLHSGSTQRAQLLTFGIMIGANAIGQAVMFQLSAPGAPVMWFGFTPVTISHALFNYQKITEFLNGGDPFSPFSRLSFLTRDPKLLCDMAGLLAYAIGAVLLSRAALSSFDRAAGRPIARKDAPAPPEPGADDARIASSPLVASPSSDGSIEEQSAGVAMASAGARP